MISVKIVADSIHAYTGKRLTTFVLTYPRFIHSEFMTHRVFSRNASSSRAIPVKKSIQMVIDDPAIPLAFTKNKPGMQGGEALTGDQEASAVSAWLAARDAAVVQAQTLSDLEVHKQYANRVLEPFSHITVVVTATEFENFYALRYHSMAQPEICELAKQMWEAHNSSKPVVMSHSEWHLPFMDEESLKECFLFIDPNGTNTSIMSLMDLATPIAIKRSVARCARVSYLNHDGTKSTVEQDLVLYDRLLGSAPVHASPAEHQARVDAEGVDSGNFKGGWIQYRQLLPHQNITEFKGPLEQ